MIKTFNSALDAVESIRSVIKNDGFDRFDSTYILNVSFALVAGYSVEGLRLSRESTIDFEWSWDAANGKYYPAPTGSYYRKRFGSDVRSYGDVWNIPELIRKIKDPSQQRRAVLYNGDDACVMAAQFWPEGDRLDMTLSLRSSDVGEMLELDIQFFKLLHHKICDFTGFTPGISVYNINVAHILK